MWTIPDPADQGGASGCRDRVRAIELARRGAKFDDPLLRQAAAAMIAYLRNDKPLAEARCAPRNRDLRRQKGAEDFHWLQGLLSRKKRPTSSSASTTRSRSGRSSALALSAAGLGLASAGQARPRRQFSEALALRPRIRRAPDLPRLQGASPIPDDRPGRRRLRTSSIRRGVHTGPRLQRARIRADASGRTTTARSRTSRRRSRRARRLPSPVDRPRGGALLKGEAREAVGDAQRAVEIEKGEGRYGCLAMRGRCRAAAGDRAEAPSKT